MASHDASIRRALSSQDDIKKRPEHCCAAPQVLATLGSAVGQQVRVTRNADEYVLYTVSEVRSGDPDDVVRVGLGGRQRLGTSDEFDAVVDTQVPHPTMSEALAEIAGEFIERLDDNGRQRKLIVIAPHGGDIERHTDQQAERVASRLAVRTVSSWRCKGWKRGGGAFDRWHITSTDIDEASFPCLASVINRGFTYAVAFHGFEESRILIGGTAPSALKEEIRAAIQGATAGSVDVDIARPEDGLGGDDPRNIVNRLTAGGANGIQIEQSFAARSSSWAAIADAVAEVYRPKLRRFPRPWRR
jgi:phage replication-related protein YjqB (UPF0714/DUF867 family)